ncbi:MAG: hypothetical protein ACREEB_08850 [Caulobacteraceae bacterium]
MYDHVLLLLSFVYALALTQPLASATGLVLARERVKFSPLHALWMLNTVALLFGNWLSYLGMKEATRWGFSRIAVMFIASIAQYLTCSVVSPSIPETGDIDMAQLYNRNRGVLALCVAALGVLASLQNWITRSDCQNNDWPLVILVNLVAVAFAFLAGFAPWRFVQWASTIAFSALIIWAVIQYSPNPVCVTPKTVLKGEAQASVGSHIGSVTHPYFVSKSKHAETTSRWPRLATSALLSPFARETLGSSRKG